MFERGIFKRVLSPGNHQLSWFRKYEVIRTSIEIPFQVTGHPLELFINHPELRELLTTFEIPDGSFGLHYINGRYHEILSTGVYTFWNILFQHEIKLVNPQLPDIDLSIEPALYKHGILLGPLVQVVEVAPHEVGLLYFDNIFQRELQPGRYFFWNISVHVSALNVDMRQQQLTFSELELTSSDQVSFSIHFVCQYRINNPKLSIQFKSLHDQMKLTIQLRVREIVRTRKLEDVLHKKHEICAFILLHLHRNHADFGVKFTNVGITSIQLPVEIREMMNHAILRQKKVSANLITPQEEYALTSGILNISKTSSDKLLQFL